MDGEWARVGRDRTADADIQEELARIVRVIEHCNIWSLAVFFVDHSERLLLRPCPWCSDHSMIESWQSDL